MSGIVGAFALDGRAVRLAELHALAAPSRHRAVDGEDYWVEPAFGIGHQHFRVTPESRTERQPFVSGGGVVVAFDGRLDNREDLVPHLDGTADRACSDAALVAAAYERFGDRFASRLNGDFALALFDPARRRLALARDRMGGRLLHYCTLPGLVLFASEIKSILNHPLVARRIDEDSLADLVLDGYSDGHRTCYQDVFSVAPGYMVAVTPDAVLRWRHWDFDPGRQIRCASFDEYAEAFRGVFHRAVRRRLRSARPAAVAVSGGLDSSAIFCEATASVRDGAAAPSVHGIAFTPPAGSAADEQVFLDSIEDVHRVRIGRLPITRIGLLDHGGEFVRHAEMPALLWDARSALLARARHLGCALVMDGYFGDQMLAGRAYLVDLARRLRWIAVGRDLRQLAAWMTDVEPAYFPREFCGQLARHVPPQALVRALARVKARRHFLMESPPWYTHRFLRRALERALARRQPDRRFWSRHAEECYRHATSGHYRVQMRQEIAAAAMHEVEIVHPFRDRDLVEFLMAVPGEIVNYGGVPKALLRRALHGTLPEPIRTRRWKADFTALNNQALVGESAEIRDLLGPGSRSASLGFVDDAILQRELNRFEARVAQAATAVPAWRFGALIGLELWLRDFTGLAAA